VTRLRDDPTEFEGAIGAAARALGLAPFFVEKDYWVTQVLRALNTRHSGWFVFKGGTSLSKGYGLIERFSEDVDILVSPAKDDSARTREELLLAMAESVAAELGLEWQQGRAPGRGRMAHRADVLVYPRTIRGSTVVPMEDRGVLLETGFAGGDWPGEMVSITRMLCEPLEIDPATYDDTSAFSIKALKPVRTLLEKLSLLHHIATNHGAGTSDARCGRPYYDIYRLLDHAATKKALEDRGQFARILSEMEDISAQHFGGFTEWPTSGYADSPGVHTGGRLGAPWMARGALRRGVRADARTNHREVADVRTDHGARLRIQDAAVGGERARGGRCRVRRHGPAWSFPTDTDDDGDTTVSIRQPTEAATGSANATDPISRGHRPTPHAEACRAPTPSRRASECATTPAPSLTG
jgi:hypothetical protein